MNRIDRVTAILIQLQSKKIVRAQEIADRFNISLRTVYRDIKTLEEAGIPILGETGIGYSIMEGYRLPPVMFTKEEATAFLTAEKLVEKLTDTSTCTIYKSAMYKIRAVLRSSEKDLLENMEDHIAVIQHNNPFNTASADNTLQFLLRGVSEKKQVFIQYKAIEAEEITKRYIEPVGIFFSTGYWYVIAWCRLRNAYRNFRTDRIRQIKLTDESFNKIHPSLKTYLSQVAEKENLQTVIIRVKKRLAKYMQESRYYHGFVTEMALNDQVEMNFLISCPETFMRWFLMYADDAEIVYPDSLRDRLQEFLSKVLEKSRQAVALLT